jgi:hypothetical protein
LIANALPAISAELWMAPGRFNATTRRTHSAATAAAEILTSCLVRGAPPAIARLSVMPATTNAGASTRCASGGNQIASVTTIDVAMGEALVASPSPRSATSVPNTPTTRKYVRSDLSVSLRNAIEPSVAGSYHRTCLAKRGRAPVPLRSMVCQDAGRRGVTAAVTGLRARSAPWGRAACRGRAGCPARR